MRYRVDFSGRTTGALGRCGKHSREVQADSRGAAVLELYKEFECIRIISLKEVPHEHEQAVCSNS